MIFWFSLCKDEIWMEKLFVWDILIDTRKCEMWRGERNWQEMRKTKNNRKLSRSTSPTDVSTLTGFESLHQIEDRLSMELLVVTANYHETQWHDFSFSDSIINRTLLGTNWLFHQPLLRIDMLILWAFAWLQIKTTAFRCKFSGACGWVKSCFLFDSW